MDFWVNNNGCDAEPLLSKSHQNSISIQIWHECRNNADVELYLLENWGHVWPGLFYSADLDKANPLTGFDAAWIIWDFFKAHTR